MKKNVLALSITAALVGIGFAGSVQAIGLGSLLGNPIPTSTLTAMRTSVDGIGQFLYVPYYTVQSGNDTLINIVNTDTINGKAVKVRFRAAANSDDVLDFQVFLSPGDVWTAKVYKDLVGSTDSNPLLTGFKATRIVSTDESCTKPVRGATDPSLAVAGTLNYEPFKVWRLDPARKGEALINETREGYVEIFNMADIPPNATRSPAPAAVTNDLYKSIKHTTKGVPFDCASDSFKALDTDFLNEAAANKGGLYAPTTGLMANWIIINGADAAAWSAAATAINGVVDPDVSLIPGPGPIVYFPQTDEPIVNPRVGVKNSDFTALFTADPVLIAHSDDDTTMIRTYDLPDFSIPYTATGTPKGAMVALSNAISTKNVINEYLTTSTIDGVTYNFDTDWVLSMPTRRYHAAYNYTDTTPTVQSGSAVIKAGPLYTKGLQTYYFTGDGTVGTGTLGNTFVVDRQICVSGLSTTFFNREEQVPPTQDSGVIVSPQPPGAPKKGFNICGEASVLSFNNGDAADAGKLISLESGALHGLVARSSIETSTFSSGWLNIATPGISNAGLPILGYEAIRAPADNSTFGATFQHRTNRVIK